jgi:DnaA family protein
MSRQLPLGIRLAREPSLENFVTGPNATALAAVRACAGGEADPYVYVWGATGSGKTYLLLAACRAAQQRDAVSQYLDLDRAGELAPDLLQDLEQLDLVCLDNVQTIAGKADWEQALFGLFNRLRDTGRRLLATADVPAAQLPLRLVDLRSRLTWGPGFRLRPLDDTARLELLQRSAAARGMQLAPAAARYMLYHCPRDLHSLEALLDRIDQISLAEKKRPTIPLIQLALRPSEDHDDR